MKKIGILIGLFVLASVFVAAAPASAAAPACSMLVGDNCDDWIVCVGPSGDRCKAGVEDDYLYCPGPLCPDPW